MCIYLRVVKLRHKGAATNAAVVDGDTDCMSTRALRDSLLVKVFPTAVDASFAGLVPVAALQLERGGSTVTEVL